MVDRLPLNGTKTHPLSEHAKEVLRSLARFNLPAHRINPGVRDRLGREELIEIREIRSSNNKSLMGGTNWVFITDAGRALVERNFQ
jgi:hypothetical protein